MAGIGQITQTAMTSLSFLHDEKPAIRKAPGAVVHVAVTNMEK
jgi:hypothetical protein